MVGLAESRCLWYISIGSEERERCENYAARAGKVNEKYREREKG